MTRSGPALTAGAVLFLAGCTHYNTLFNAQHIYDRAERDRRAGLHAAAAAGYRDVASKTADAYRARPEGPETAEILLLLGRSQLRLGNAREAIGALEHARDVAGSGPFRADIEAFLAAALEREGDRLGGWRLARESLAATPSPEGQAEAYAVVARVMLAEGRLDDAWSALDAAVRADPAASAELALERLTSAVREGTPEHARRATEIILADAAAGERADSVASLVGAYARVHGRAAAAELLGPLDSTTWEPEPRGRLRLERARFLWSTGDSLAADRDAWIVAGGRGDASAQARLLLARRVLSGARQVSDVAAALPILLPAGWNPAVVDLLEGLDLLDRYAELGSEDPLGWFAAAEVARDRLGAPVLARGLFLAYADSDPDDPWASKALLAALDVSPDATDRDWLRGRLEEHPRSPYVLAARGREAPDYTSLEETLEARLLELASR